MANINILSQCLHGVATLPKCSINNQTVVVTGTRLLSTSRRPGSKTLLAHWNKQGLVSGQRLHIAIVPASPLMGLGLEIHANTNANGPLYEYNRRIECGRLKQDEHQKTIVQSLQDLHDMLITYTPPVVVAPSLPSLKQPAVKSSFFASIFSWHRRLPAVSAQMLAKVPKGLYMYGDVGSGKTMLMDIFYDTLPPNIVSKSRIHFHNFMQEVHKRLHAMKMELGVDFDAIPFVAADMARSATVLCFDEFQCTDVADAMILRRLLESLLSYGVVLVTTSNRHPDELYKNGIQRQHFIPCINLLKSRLHVLNLDSHTDYRKIPRPPSGVYHHPLDLAAASHADKWFQFLGSPETDPPHPVLLRVWGRDLRVPLASGSCAKFTFDELIRHPKSAADYLELVRAFDAFVVTDVPGMDYKTRDLARRFITFVDAVYESRARLVLTTAVPLYELFASHDELAEAISEQPGILNDSGDKDVHNAATHEALDSQGMQHLMDDLGLTVSALKKSSIFTGEEERFAFARALSRLTEMKSQEWVERGMGLEMKGGKKEREGFLKTRSRWREDSG